MKKNLGGNKKFMENRVMENLGGEVEMVFSVGEYIETVNALVGKLKVKITGEITVAKVYPSGHCYFTIKDSSPNNQTASSLECIIWKYDYRMCGVNLAPGMEVILTGAGQVYTVNGKFSFVAKTVELKGEGALKKAYDELKDKLEKEGVFAEEKKKALPEFPQKIGVITSKQGAVIHDLLNNLGKFGFQIKMVDSRVEGQEAIGDLLGAIKTISKQSIDLLVIMRGGGSLESLQPFNNEALIRAIVGFKVPIIVAIGHDKDVPLLALAADFAPSTPTAVAIAINKSWENALAQINLKESVIIGKFGNALVKYRGFEYALVANLNKIAGQIVADKTLLKTKAQQILAKLENQIKAIVQQFYFISRAVTVNDPAKNLALGYCIARKNGKVIKSIKNVNIGNDFDLQLQDGILNSTVNEITN